MVYAYRTILMGSQIYNYRVQIFAMWPHKLVKECGPDILLQAFSVAGPTC